MSSIGSFVRGVVVVGFLSTFLLSNALVIPSTAWTDIELAVDTANFNQDGLLVLFGGLRMQGHVGLPVGSGDINGDGRSDVIICGMYGSTFPRENNGVVSFYLSDGRDSGFVDAAENPPSIFRLTGQRGGDLLGTSVSVNADINGDGIKDVAMGALGWDSPSGGVDNEAACCLWLVQLQSEADLSTGDGNPPPGHRDLRAQSGPVPECGSKATSTAMDWGRVIGADVQPGASSMSAAPHCLRLEEPAVDDRPRRPRTARIVGQRSTGERLFRLATSTTMGSAT
jgi:hypothetical protein